MARVDLSLREMTLLAHSLELHAEQLAQGDAVELAIELSLIHLKLLKACRDELVLDRRALEEEHRV